jgi:sigma-B regulation protein RsbU (phosphoserine phosphatase)
MDVSGVGDSLLVYTDGLTEARDPGGEQYGLQRVRNLAARHHGLKPSDLVVECLSDLLNFTKGAKQTDDLTLLAIRRTP